MFLRKQHVFRSKDGKETKVFDALEWPDLLN